MTKPGIRMLTNGHLKPLENDDSLKPRRFRLPLSEVTVDPESRLRRVHVFRSQRTASIQHPEKIVLLVGETGVGKTTLINNLVNYYYGIQWDDEFRLILIAAEDEGNEGAIRDQSESQTRWITAYTLHWQPDCAVSYTLTLIDTPGYNDPRGVQCDTDTTTSLGKFFNLGAVDEGIDQIDAVCFVVSGSQHRLTTGQKYVFHAVLSIFGKDIEENIVLMATHVDGTNSKVGDAAKAGGVPFQDCFIFNNSALFSRNEKNSQEEGQHYDEDEVYGDKIKWKNNTQNTHKFFQRLNFLKPKSLKLTKEVLRQRQCLQSILENNKKEIADGIIDLSNLHSKIQYLEGISSDPNVDATREKQYVETRVVERKALPSSERATNCDLCQLTCHYPCTQESHELWRCRAMDYCYYEVAFIFLHLSSPRNTNCNICPRRCPSSSHSTASFQYSPTTEKRVVDLQSIREDYQPEGQVLSLTELDRNVEQESSKTRAKVYRLLLQMNSIISELETISLRPHVTEVGRIMQTMINDETSSASDGWKNRTDQLNRLLQHHQLIQEIKTLANRIPT